MPRTIILRYSDYEVDTIPAHQEIIRSEKSVWWGWWKKKHESMQSEALIEMKKKCPIEIGLVNRSAQEFYSACCTKIGFDVKRVRRKSPNPTRTPSYYRKSLHPAWFEFSSIERLPLETFRRKFSDVPLGNPTLYLVEEKGSRTSVLPALSTGDLDITKTKGDSILHISDLHFGEDHGFVTVRQDDPIREQTLVSIIGERVRSISDVTIGVVIVSGDLITKGDTNGYVHASAFLNSLLKELGLGKEHIVMVPGNHDIWTRDIEHPTWDYQPEEPFRQFLRSFYGRDISEIEHLWVFQTPGRWHLSFVGLNSARPRKKETKDYGYVGSDNYQPWLRRMTESADGKNASELAREMRLNFAVLHHHLLPAGLVCKPEVNRPVSLTLASLWLISKPQVFVLPSMDISTFRS